MTKERNLQIRCATWSQVEAFYTRKLRRGNLLSVKVAFAVSAGMPITIGIEMPTGIVLAIGGIVRRVSEVAGESRTWIEIELVGLTEETLVRLKRMVAQGEAESAAVPTVDVLEIDAELPPLPEHAFAGVELAADSSADERTRFVELSAQLRRFRTLAVHELLGVGIDASAQQVRGGWRVLVRRFHPDSVARFRSPAVTHLAEEINILINRAYDRMRHLLVEQGRGAIFGSTVVAPHGWLVGFEDLSTSEPAAPRPRTRSGRVVPATFVAPTGAAGAAMGGVTGASSPLSIAAAQDGGSFEVRARSLLAAGDADGAKEMLAMLLVVYPRSRTLRSLYYLASALVALATDQAMLAISQLEAALVHDEHCREAQQLLDYLQRQQPVDTNVLAEVFGAYG
ncbi:MAG: J domain-containing protein [Kofleriaceae bacterium]|nr:J domain-containing protein [Kofleriaceae bacterium]